MTRIPAFIAGGVTALILAASAPAQVTVAERLGPASFRIATLAAPGAAALTVGALDPVSFLDLRWTNAIESFSPRTDIPREEAFTYGIRIRLPGGARLYRVLGPGGTAVVQVGDTGAGVLAAATGDGITSGISSLAAVSPFDPWIATSTIGTPGAPPRIILARTDRPAGTATFDVTPPGGWPALNGSSLTFATGALYFTTSGGSLWRVPLDTRIPSAIPLPGPTNVIDHEIAVSAGGGTIALRAGASPSAQQVHAVSVATSTVASFGPPGSKLGVNYADPGRRPRISVSPDGTLVPHFSATPASLDFIVGENYGFHFSPLLVSSGIAWLVGVESELAIGDGGQTLTFLIPVPGAGNVLVSLPYPVLSLVLGLVGQNLFTLFQSTFNLYPGTPAGSAHIAGHFQFAPEGLRFFVMGPAPAAFDLIQVTPGAGGGGVRVPGLAAVHESVRFGNDLLLVRATAAGGGSPAVFAVPLPSGSVFSSDILGPGAVSRLAGSPDGLSAAFVFAPTAGNAVLWRFDLNESAVPAPFAPSADIGSDIQWRGDGLLMIRTGAGTIQSLDSSGAVAVWNVGTVDREIL